MKIDVIPDSLSPLSGDLSRFVIVSLLGVAAVCWVVGGVCCFKENGG